MATRLRERAVIDQFKDLVKALFPDSFVWKFHQGPMSGTGFPDLLLVLEGVSVHVEAKRFRGRLSGMQEKILYNIKLAGGRCGVLKGGNKLNELILTPWRRKDGSEFVLDLRNDGKDLLREKLRQFIHDCDPTTDTAEAGDPSVD